MSGSSHSRKCPTESVEIVTRISFTLGYSDDIAVESVTWCLSRRCPS
jgi:hypothetical protein